MLSDCTTSASPLPASRAAPTYASRTNALVKLSGYVCAAMNDPEDTEETEDLDDLDILRTSGRALGTENYISSMS